MERDCAQYAGINQSAAPARLGEEDLIAPSPFNRIIERLSKTHDHINSIAQQLGENADRMFGQIPQGTSGENARCASSYGGLAGEIEEQVLRINAALDWLEYEAKRNCEA